MSFGLDFERLPIARPLAIFDMAPTAGNETFRSSCAPNHRASQRGPDRDASPMTRVAAVKVAVGNDDRKTYAEMLKTTQRRRRVDKAKVHQALALLARDLDLFVGSFNARLKTVAQLTFHDAPDDLRVASIARSQEKKKRSRRAGAQVQRGRRNEAKRGRGMKASPNPIFQPTNEDDPDKSPGGRWREPPRKVSAVEQKNERAKDAGQLEGKARKRPELRLQASAGEASPMVTSVLKERNEAVAFVPAAQDPELASWHLQGQLAKEKMVNKEVRHEMEKWQEAAPEGEEPTRALVIEERAVASVPYVEQERKLIVMKPKQMWFQEQEQQIAELRGQLLVLEEEKEKENHGRKKKKKK